MTKFKTNSRWQEQDREDITKGTMDYKHWNKVQQTVNTFPDRDLLNMMTSSVSVECMGRIAFSEIIRRLYMKMIYGKKYGPMICACGEHNCEDCTNNANGNPENCQHWECYVGAVCHFDEIKPGAEYDKQ